MITGMRAVFEALMNMTFYTHESFCHRLSDSFALTYLLSVEIPLPSWMSLAGLPYHFSAVQLHLHWGNGMVVGTGSEHSIDEQKASAEVCVCMC